MQQHLDQVKKAISHYPVRNSRLPSAPGDDRLGSDVDILVDSLPQTSLYDLAELEPELERILAARSTFARPANWLPEVAERVASDLKPM